MRKILILCLVLITTACSEKPADAAAKLNGYWIIDRVTMQDGSEREFPFTNHMDHFTIKGSTGIKNRVSPAYDGTFIDYGSPVTFTWQDRDGALFLQFKEKEQLYEQEVVKVNPKNLVLRHENGTTYYYKSYDGTQQ